MKDVIFVLLDKWADWECAFLSTALNMGVKPGSPVKYRTKTMSIDKEDKLSLGNLRVAIDCDIETMPADYAALILIGGMSWFADEAEQLVPVVKKAIDDGKIVGAICNGSVFLGKHGFLNKVKHTSNGLELLKDYAGANYNNESGYIHQQAVSDKNIVTANGSGYLEFSKEILSLLDADTAEVIDEYYDYFKIGFCELYKS